MSSIIRSLAVSVLSRYLGEYVVGLDSEHLDISISSGDACLEHLELRASALDSMDLPITVRAGFLEKVKINIPWTSIRSQPASIEISGLYLLAGPRKETEFDMETEMRRAQSDKQKRLLVAEMLRGRGGSDDSAASAAASKKDDGFTGRLIALVLNNVQVRVKHVHMRYEDDRTTPARPFVCGITLESFSGVTVDEAGAPAFVVDPKGFIHKLVELRNFAVYWDSQGRHLEFSTGQEMRAAMDALIWKEDQVHEPSLSYLLLPVSGKLQLAMLRDSVVTDFDKPQLLLEFMFENIRVMLHESQYKDFAALAEGFRLQSLRAPYVSLQRPAERPTADARGWWNYTLRCVQQDLREERARWSWERILQRKKDRVRYIVLYCQLKRSGPTAVQPPELVELEERLSYEDILMYRSLCEALLRRESASGSAVVSSPSGSPTKGGAEASGEVKPGYLGWMIGWAYASAPSEAALGESGNDNNVATDNAPDSGGVRQVSASERLLTSKFMNELYAAVDDEERGRGASGATAPDASVAPLPEEYVRRKIVFSLGQGSVTLVEANSQVLSTMVFSQLSCGLDSRTERHTFSAALNSMQLFHGRVPIIASPLNAPNAIWTGTFEMGTSAASAAVGKHDFSIKLHVRPLSLLFSRPFTEGLVHFFVRRRGHAWRDIQDFTGATAQIDALQRQATNQLREVIENKRSVYIAIQVDAPRIFVPEDVAKPLCSVLTVQMESLTIGTVVRERLAPNLVTQELVQQNSDLFYDQYTLSIARVQLALVKPIGEWRWDAFAECCGPEVPLIDPCALEFSLQHCLVDVPYLPTIKLATALPNVRAFLSAKQFLSFVICLRTVVSEDVDDLAVDPALVSQAVLVPFSDEEILSLADPRGSEQWIVDKERARKLQVSFRIERASVVLHHGKTDRNVAVLSFVDFNISVAKLPKEMHFAIFLHQLELVDLTKPPDSPARFLVRSIELPGVGGASNHLVTVRFVGIHRDASSYEGVDYDVDMHMMEMDCVCNRDTVANLIDLGNDILDGLAATAPAQAIERKAAAAAVPPVDVAGLFLKVRFRMDSLRIQFALEGGAAFAEAHIAQWDQVMRFRNDDTWSLDIRVGTTVLSDLRPVATRWAKGVAADWRRDASLYF
jgi:vacuolar protein sorting-associated protein 13A/C